MIIRSLKQNDAEHVTLVLENGEEIPSTLGVVTELRLFAGKTVEDAQLALLREKTARALACDHALLLLSQRAHSRKELCDKLIRKGESPEAAEAAIEWLTEHGYLDDAAFAKTVARHYSRKGYGAQRIRAELSRRGLARELWDEAMEQIAEPDEQIDAYLRRHLKNADDRKEIQKLSAALVRRGYAWEEIRAAFARLDRND